MCRGLITDLDGNIIARPFKKFFNLEEIDKTPEIAELIVSSETPYISAKFDGSLGVLYFDGNIPKIATRGSFVSDQAIHATELLNRNKAFSKESFIPNMTYLFEIIYSDNRIVCDYGNLDTLVLLSIIDNETGKERVDLLETEAARLDLGVASKQLLFDDVSCLKTLIKDNEEGFVIYWPESDVRAKVKGDEYIRLHRLLTDFSSLNIWDLLRNDQPFDEFLERVPDEFFSWVSSNKNDLEGKYNGIELLAKAIIHSELDGLSRKDIALQLITQNTNSIVKSVIFAMLDNKPYKDIIWRSLRPKFQKPFKKDENNPDSTL